MRKGESRKTASFNVLRKIEAEKEKRGWNDYQLAQNAEINQSIISTWKKRSIEPSLASIEMLCTAFGITLSEFFSEDEGPVVLTSEQKETLDLWNGFLPEQRKAITDLLKAMSEKKN